MPLAMTTAVAPAPRSLLDLTFAELERELTTAGLASVHTRPLWRTLHRGLNLDLSTESDFPPPLQRWLAANLGPGRRFFLEAPVATADIASTDGFTRKFLLRLADS